MAADFTQFPIETATITERVASNPATLPLAGTETLLIDQGGTTKGATAAAIAATLPEATTTAAGKLSVGDKAKLNSIASNATANASDAELRDRATHTGEQAISTVTGLQTALDGKEAAGAASSISSSISSRSAQQRQTRPQRPNAAQSAAIAASAPAAQGVTNGNSHDHAGGDGAQIDYSSLSGLPSLTATATATPAGGLSIQSGNLVPGEIIKLIVSDLGETGIATGNSKSEVRIDRAFVVLGVWWNCHPSAMASAGTSEARPYIRTGAGTTSAGTKTNLLTSAGNIASLAASVHTVDATSLISGGTYSGSAGDWLGVDIMSIGTGSSGHQLTYLLRYS
jgi:hypothetical protein